MLRPVSRSISPATAGLGGECAVVSNELDARANAPFPWVLLKKWQMVCQVMVF